MRNWIIACAVCAALGAALGYRYGTHKGDLATAKAVAEANEANLKRNDEVVNGWANAVDLLRARLRAGMGPRIPVSGPAAEGNAACGLDGRTAYGLSAAGELATCKAERQRLIEDCSMTTIQLRSLQDWAR